VFSGLLLVASCGVFIVNQVGLGVVKTCWPCAARDAATLTNRAGSEHEAKEMMYNVRLFNSSLEGQLALYNIQQLCMLYYPMEP